MDDRALSRLFHCSKRPSKLDSTRYREHGRAVIVGLTGGIASGKSTVAAMLADLGAEIVDADEIAHDIEKPGRPAYREIADRFGRDVLLPDGRIDRARLGRLVFADAQARGDLERITHPRIRTLIVERVADALKRQVSPVVVDIPLLFESGGEYGFDGVMLVYAPEPVQQRRLMARDHLDVEEAQQRIATQLPIAEKESRATWVIDNGAGLDATRKQVHEWWNSHVR